jgi:hypothetical protein
MRLSLFCRVTLIGVTLPVACAFGHGTPIQVTVNSGQLVVSGGLSDSMGFASQIFVEDDEDGEGLPMVNLPLVGQSTLWQIPGLDILGMASTSSLSIQVLPRPVINEVASERALLWFWNPSSTLGKAAPEGSVFHLLALENRFLTLTPDDMAAPAPLELADPLAGQTGFHNHALLNYALRDAPAPPAGAYGFFAQLTSNQYAASNPFLVVLNYGVDYSNMPAAALAINAAAFLPGDYNRDDAVGFMDYGVWKRNYGESVAPFASADGNGDGAVTAADYTIWRNNLGAAVTASGSELLAGVPEPATFGLSVVGVLSLFARLRVQRLQRQQK